jgi:hypothetical protein
MRSLMARLQQGFGTGEIGAGVKLRSSNFEPSMSALGQKQTLQCILVMSALPPKSGHWLSASGCLLCAKSGSQRHESQPFIAPKIGGYAFFDIDRRNFLPLIRSSRSILALRLVRSLVRPVANISFIGVQ